MSRENKTHLLHVRSSQLENGQAKLPSSDDLLYGELAINFVKGYETLSIKNSEDEIVPLCFRNIVNGVNVNGVDATIENNIATVVISGSDENVGEYEHVEYQEKLSGAVNVSGDQTISEAFNAVETTISSLTQELINDEIVTAKAILALANAAGTMDGDEISYNVNENANYINVATSLADADNILDAEIKRLSDSVITSITSVTLNDIVSTSENQNAILSISGNDINVGQYESVEYPQEFSGAVNVSGDQTIAEAFNSVETTISSLTMDVFDLANAAGTIEGDDIHYVINENAYYINSAISLSDADNILDETINNIDNRVVYLENNMLSSMTVNDVEAVIENGSASVVISGSDENVGEYDSIEYPQAFDDAVNVSGDQTIAEAFNAVETTISGLAKEVIDNEIVTAKAILALANAAGTLDGDEIIYNVNENANYINVATSLADADNILDAVIKDAKDNIEYLEDNMITSITVNNVEATIEDGDATVVISGSNENVGQYTSVQYPQEFTKAVNVSGSQKISEAFNAVETTISGLTRDYLDSTESILNNISDLANAAGTIEGDEIKYVVNENASYINSATSLADADNILDAEIRRLSDSVITSITSVTLNDIMSTNIDQNADLTISGSDINVGQYDSVSYPQEFTKAVNVSGSQEISEAFNAVETTISGLTRDYLDSTESITNNISNLAIAAGTIEGDEIQYVVNENANYIYSATSLIDADNILDESINNVENNVYELSAKTLTSITVNDVAATIANGSATVEISGSDENVGIYESVEYPQEFSGAVNVSGVQTIAEALNAVETTISALTVEVIHNEETDTNAIYDLCDAIGNVVDSQTGQIKYIPNYGDEILKRANSYNDAVLLLSAEIQNLSNQVTQILNELGH